MTFVVNGRKSFNSHPGFLFHVKFKWLLPYTDMFKNFKLHLQICEEMKTSLKIMAYSFYNQATYSVMNLKAEFNSISYLLDFLFF